MTTDSLCTYTAENLEFLDTPIHTLHVHVVTMHEHKKIMMVLIVSVRQIVTGFTKTVLIGTRNEIQFIANY